MTFPCIAAARHFEYSAHVPLVIGAQRFGWIRRRDVEHLRRWPDVFEISSLAVRIHPRHDSCEARTAALEPVIAALHAEGVIVGWRNERYAIRQRLYDAPLAWIERAAARFFGTRTFAVHVNGFVPARVTGEAPQLWIARRSVLKSTDPGCLDNAVGGGIGDGYGVGDTLVKECWEEAGIPAPLAREATPGRTLHVLAEIPEGVQAEQIFVYDLALPASFVPANQDGEASAHWLCSAGNVRDVIARGAMTVDASLVSLDFLMREGVVREHECAGMAALFHPPEE
ncbi:NUDIX hydrolase [Pandoraea terrae]|uniref:NUDIX hydrolase n=1 Tax=Pandoraea terrae TaxID=1537710 RepID=A0A5E4WFW5_9BURK|nr:DUF4743 domain-containing protein [Pandoraea terrae]VVE22464.1 NUDIX hydrolase [Pandoraea terrae]